MGVNVLIVEDDFIIQMFLSNVITDVGCNVMGKVSNSEDALMFVSQQTPDIILMDIGISGDKDGVETAEIINELYDLPIVFITGNSDVKTLERAVNTNPVHIIRKPIDEDMLKYECKLILAKLNINLK